MQFGVFGGDGGGITGYYLGRDMPAWVLYTDGQLLFRKSDKKGDWFTETTLTVPQMCTLLSRIERTGFFKLPGDGSRDTSDPIYQFDSTARFSDGLPNYIIQVNGPQQKHMLIYWDYVPYLTQEARAAFDFFNKYTPPAKLTPYQAQYAMMWIEKGQGFLAYVTPAPTAQAWPTGVPPLETLAGNKLAIPENPDESFGPQGSEVFVEGKDVQLILKLFDNHLTAKLFSTSSGEYYVIARPVLPHETLNDNTSSPYKDAEFELPFKCK